MANKDKFGLKEKLNNLKRIRSRIEGNSDENIIKDVEYLDKEIKVIDERFET